MNATKLYIICHTIIYLAMIAGITLCAIFLDNYGLMWWYLLPALCGGLEVTSGGKNSGE